ncbi:hypothetical protein Tco_1200015 [Tanacetum coccineum]
MFDEYLNPPPCVDLQVPTNIALEHVVSTATPSSTTIDQDALSTSTSQTNQETPSPVIPLGVEEADHDIEVAHMDNNPYDDFPILEPSSKESSTQVVILNNVHTINQPPEHIKKLTKDHPIDDVIGDPSRPVTTQHQLQDEAPFYYFDAFLSSVEPKSYKEALMESCWIEAMQEELNEFECLEVWELIGKCNMRIDPEKTQKEPTYQVVLDALDFTTFYPAFLITASIPVIQDDKKRFSVDMEVFREIL